MMPSARNGRTYATFSLVLFLSNAFTWWINVHYANHHHHHDARRRVDGEQLNLWQRNADDNLRQQQQQQRPPFTVDILSVGSTSRPDYLSAQARTFASHPAVRNFFNVTEVDDADPRCRAKLTMKHVHGVSKFCRDKGRDGQGRRRKDLSPVHRHMLGQYATGQWLTKKDDPAGWMCAQPRPFAGLMKAYKHYEATGEELPGWFIVMDDDTYYHLDWFRSTMEALDDAVSSETCYAGCLIRMPIQYINFTMPYGGYGTIIGREVLRRIFRKIHCPSGFFDADVGDDGDVAKFFDGGDGNDLFMHDVCTRLREDNVQERRHFRDGMNLAELMYRYATEDAYENVSDWKKVDGGFCFHSDWVIGYFVNYYNVSMHVADEFYKDVPHSRIEAIGMSEVYGRRKSGFCRQDRILKGVKKVCNHGVKVCHRVTPEWMDVEFRGFMEK